MNPFGEPEPPLDPPVLTRDALPGPALEGAPDIPTEAGEELLSLKSGAMFLCARHDGDIGSRRAGDRGLIRPSGEGLYAQDTRHLSELRVTVGGAAPVGLSCAMESGHHAVINATNPGLRSIDGAPIGQETLNVRRTLLIGDRLYYQLRVRNFDGAGIRTVVAVSLGADFADVFEVRGVERRTTGRLLAPERDGAGVRFRYLAADGERRETRIGLQPAPQRVTIDGDRVHVVWEIALDPGEAAMLLITALPVHGAPAPDAPTLAQTSAAQASEHTRWVGNCSRIVTDARLLDRVIDASVRDLHALMMPVGPSSLPAAGIPWYVAPFGRDSLLTAIECLILNPDVARGTLRALAALQADRDEPWRDAEPGKILHELRSGELARTGHIPHTPYYGTADATPLFLLLAAEYFRWTADLSTMAQVRPALDAALRWIDEWGDRDGDGFVEYEQRAPAGLINHCWKDSHDSIVHADGSLAEGPLALVEIQGYVYAAKQGIAGVYDALGEAARAADLRGQAAALRSAFNAAFWNPAERYFALALDGRKAQVMSVTSNPAHCLWCGIVDDDKAAAVAARLMAPDMFSGWGIRTLSSRSPAYNPMSYHNGSIWPHDNAIAAAGLKRYGFLDATEQIAAALFEIAADARDMRLPELFCGFDRDGSRAIVAYPVACIPQAWAAAAPFMLLQALLGITAQALDYRLTVHHPRLPQSLSRIDLHDIRIGAATVGLAFQRLGSSVGFSLLEQDGGVQVVIVP